MGLSDPVKGLMRAWESSRTGRGILGGGMIQRCDCVEIVLRLLIFS